MDYVRSNLSHIFCTLDYEKQALKDHIFRNKWTISVHVGGNMSAKYGNIFVPLWTKYNSISHTVKYPI